MDAQGCGNAVIIFTHPRLSTQSKVDTQHRHTHQNRKMNQSHIRTAYHEECISNLFFAAAAMALESASVIIVRLEFQNAFTDSFQKTITSNRYKGIPLYSSDCANASRNVNQSKEYINHWSIYQKRIAVQG